MVMVPCAASTTPVSSNWTGPTKLRLVSEGGGPKYDRGTVAPTDGGAGNKLHPGPGPIGPGPGPWSELKVVEAAVVGAAVAVAASSKLVVGATATGRLARACIARISGESGCLAGTWAACQGPEDTAKEKITASVRIGLISLMRELPSGVLSCL